MKRIVLGLVKWGGIALALLLVAVGLYATWRVRRAWPEENGTVEAPGLEAPVEVVRDRWGVPHLWAANDHDLFFAQGYVHAQDRMWQMEFNRLVSAGALGSVLGPGLTDADRFLRTLGLRRAAERDWAAMEAAGGEAKAALEAYSAGVNRFLETHRDRLPVEFSILRVDPAPWTPVDSLAWGKLMSLTLSLNHPTELLRAQIAEKLGPQAVTELMAPYPADAPVIVPDGASGPRVEAQARALFGAVRTDALAPRHPVLAALLGERGMAWGSNSWAVSGSRTESGRPLLANDTHLGLGLPSVWYENGLHGGTIDAVGFSFPGLPLVVIGQNRRIAWGITNMCSDVQDFFVEHLDDPKHPTRYEVEGAWRPLEVIHETLERAGADPVDLEVRRTRHGPLMNGVMPELADAQPMALQWTAETQGAGLVASLLALDRAGSWQEFHAALAGWDGPSVNFTYAGVDGHIAYQGTGPVPIRPAGDDGTMPVPGWDGAHEWQGFIPYEEMPHAVDPPAGFLVTANNKTVGPGYPYFIAQDMADPYRAERITRTLAGDDRVGVDDARRLQADLYSIPGSELRPYLLAVRPDSDLERRALEQVKSWDLRVTAASPGAAVYEAWFYFLWPSVFGDELGEDLANSYRALGISRTPMLVALMADPGNRWFDDVTTPEREGRDEIVARAFHRAVAFLAERYGDDPAAWSWGEAHTVTFAHAPLGQSGIAPLEWIFNAGPMPAAGDIFTVDEGTPDLSHPFAMTFGVSQRFIADLADLSRSLAVNSTGQSGLAFHRHRADQVALWSRVEYHTVLTTRKAADAAAEGHLRLVPGGGGGGR